MSTLEYIKKKKTLSKVYIISNCQSKGEKNDMIPYTYYFLTQE